MSMCTKDEAKQAVIDALYHSDEDGETIIGKEINEHLTNKGNQIISKLTIRFGIAFVGLVLSFAGTWYSLYYQVQDNTSRINGVIETTEDIFTQKEADTLEIEFKQNILELKEADTKLREEYNDSLNIIRSDIRELRNVILRNQ